MNTCQYCGTELNNPRAKNCSICSGILQEANKRRTYGHVMEAVATAKESGRAGAEVHDAMRDAMKRGAAAIAEFKQRQRERDRQRAGEYARREQERQAYFDTHGYWPDDESVLADIEAQREFDRNRRPGSRYDDQTEEGLAGRGL
jgi:hypothetical protein